MSSESAEKWIKPADYHRSKEEQAFNDFMDGEIPAPLEEARKVYNRLVFSIIYGAAWDRAVSEAIKICIRNAEANEKEGESVFAKGCRSSGRIIERELK